jgi:hypothetical protein
MNMKITRPIAKQGDRESLQRKKTECFGGTVPGSRKCFIGGDAFINDGSQGQ